MDRFGSANQQEACLIPHSTLEFHKGCIPRSQLREGKQHIAEPYLVGLVGQRVSITLQQTNTTHHNVQLVLLDKVDKLISLERSMVLVGVFVSNHFWY